MRQKFFIFISIVVLLFVLIGLNAASYVKKEQTPDSEMNPNRSTYNTGATGTRAFYDLLAETGRPVSRWQEPTSALAVGDKNQPDVFVFIGQERREITDAEIESLLRWVSKGGRLVVIDREPPAELIKTTANWKISSDAAEPPLFTDPADIAQMTEKTAAAKPIQPTAFTNRVNAVQTSRFASAISFERFSETPTVDSNAAAPKPAPTFATSDKTKYEPPPRVFSTPAGNSNGSGAANEDEDYYDEDDAPVATNGTLEKLKDKEIVGAVIKSAPEDSKNSQMTTFAPVAHLADRNKITLVDFPFGAGRVVFLSDPFVVSNGGIRLVDNAQLAINLVASGGIVAFDEYHQGFGAGQNRLLDYFAGTPLTAIFWQFAALAAVILFTQSRRFARALPSDAPNRLSKLEYVGAMAELQQRTRAFDLAMENIYKDFRRRVSRLVGADALKTPRNDLARLIAERLKSNTVEIETLLEKCENIMHGEPTRKKEMLELTSKLREIEEKLGLSRRKRRNKTV